MCVFERREPRILLYQIKRQNLRRYHDGQVGDHGEQRDERQQPRQRGLFEQRSLESFVSAEEKHKVDHQTDVDEQKLEIRQVAVDVVQDERRSELQQTVEDHEFENTE